MRQQLTERRERLEADLAKVNQRGGELQLELQQLTQKSQNIAGAIALCKELLETLPPENETASH